MGRLHGHRRRPAGAAPRANRRGKPHRAARARHERRGGRQLRVRRHPVAGRLPVPADLDRAAPLLADRERRLPLPRRPGQQRHHALRRHHRVRPRGLPAGPEREPLRARARRAEPGGGQRRVGVLPGRRRVPHP
ncbi:MAG: hypothetical protein ACK55I_37210, partial [bacterium]